MNEAARMLISVERDGELDRVAVEEPLEIRVDGEPLAVTMRTPGADEELALGFLYGEGLIDEAREVRLPADLPANAVEVLGPLRGDPSSRRFYTSSSCGVCGKGALEEVAVQAPRMGDGPVVDRALLADLPDRLAQPAFERSGGLHATGLFDAAGSLLVAREDVGRHNAMDKAIGAELLAGRYPLPGVVACLSGRAAFELVQKASLAGLAGLVAVGAPSTLAVELARARDMVLCGFVRDGTFNVYAGEQHVAG
jgi:FdhD protein